MVACLHSLVAVQVLVLCAFLTPNQDLAFVLAVSYDVLSSLLAGVWVYIGNMVRRGPPDMDGVSGSGCFIGKCARSIGFVHAPDLAIMQDLQTHPQAPTCLILSAISTVYAYHIILQWYGSVMCLFEAMAVRIGGHRWTNCLGLVEELFSGCRWAF